MSQALAQPPLKSSANRIQSALEKAGVPFAVRDFPAGTKTAADAAAAIGCTVAEIAKSVIFRANPSGRVVLVLTSGANRVDEVKVAAALAAELNGDTLGRADAEFVRSQTGFAIGGVGPVGHLTQPITALDETLLQYQTLWAAGGTPSSVFPITPADLLRVTGAKIISVC